MIKIIIDDDDDNDDDDLRIIVCILKCMICTLQWWYNIDFNFKELVISSFWK